LNTYINIWSHAEEGATQVKNVHVQKIAFAATLQELAWNRV